MSSQSSTLSPIPDGILNYVNPNFAAAVARNQWKPGVCTNPGGRPSYKIMSDACARKLIEVPNPETGESRADIIAERVVTAAEAGDIQAFTAVRDTVEGRPAQQVNLNAEILTETTDERRNRMLAVLTALASLQESPE